MLFKFCLHGNLEEIDFIPQHDYLEREARKSNVFKVAPLVSGRPAPAGAQARSLSPSAAHQAAELFNPPKQAALKQWHML